MANEMDDFWAAVKADLAERITRKAQDERLVWAHQTASGREVVDKVEPLPSPVTVAQLDGWLKAEQAIPPEIARAVIDLLLEAEVELASKGEEKDDKQQARAEFWDQQQGND